MEAYARTPGGLSPESPPNPLLQVMKSNDPPTRGERQLACQHVEDIDKELEKLQTEIGTLDSQLTRLQARVTSLRHTRNEYLPIFSPCRRIPVDILTEIMQTAVNPGSLKLLSPDNQSTDRTHFKNLRSVCRTWRDVAFATRSLWTSVWVDFDQYPREEVPAVIRGIAKYFARSGSCLPLYLGFSWKGDPDSIPVPEEQEIGDTQENIAHLGQLTNSLFSDVWLAYLYSQRSRLLEISLFATTRHFENNFEKRLKGWSLAGQTWETESLGAYLDWNWLVEPGNDHAQDNAGAILASFPKLKAARVRGTEQALKLDLLKTGHPELPSFEMVMPHNMNYCFSGLGAFTNVNHLYLSVPLSSAEVNVVPLSLNAPSVDLPRLESLVINGLPSFSVLSKLQTPALERFRIISTIPKSERRWRTLQKSLSSTFLDAIVFVSKAKKLSAFDLNGWFIQHDIDLLLMFLALSTVQTICIDTWLHEEKSPQYIASILSSMVKLCIHSPDESTPHLRSSSSLSTSVSGDAGTSNGDDYRTASLPFCRQPMYWKSSLSAYLKAYSLAIPNIPQSRRDTLGSGELFGLDVFLAQDAVDKGGKDAQDTVETIQQLPGIDVTLVPESCPIFW